jgi:predicted enzyme related to lactoylglutathione lyase
MRHCHSFGLLRRPSEGSDPADALLRLRGPAILASVQVILAVSDLARSLDFYERSFGWPRNERIDYRNYIELLPEDGGSLGLFEREGFAGLVGAEPAKPEEGQVAPAYVYVRVHDLSASVDRLEAAGGKPLSPPADRSWGERAAWFADPDGNVVAVAEAPPAGS